LRWHRWKGRGSSLHHHLWHRLQQILISSDLHRGILKAHAIHLIIHLVIHWRLIVRQRCYFLLETEVTEVDVLEDRMALLLLLRATWLVQHVAEGVLDELLAILGRSALEVAPWLLGRRLGAAWLLGLLSERVEVWLLRLRWRRTERVVAHWRLSPRRRNALKAGKPQELMHLAEILVGIPTRCVAELASLCQRDVLQAQVEF